MEAPRGTFIQLSCAANQASDNNLFGKHLLETIAQENVEISAIFQDISNKVYTESNNQQRPFSMNGLQPGQQVYLNGKYLFQEIQAINFLKVFLTTRQFPLLVVIYRRLPHVISSYFQNCRLFSLAYESKICVCLNRCRSFNGTVFNDQTLDDRGKKLLRRM